MRRMYLATRPCRPILVLGLALAIQTMLVAQESEFAATRFVPLDTCGVISVNMQTILQRLDPEDPLVGKFLEASEEATGMDFARLDRILSMVSSRASDDPTDPGIPSATLMQYRDAVDPATYVFKNESANSCTFERTQYNGQDIYVGTYRETSAAGLTNPVLFFPDSHLVIQGDRNMIRQMIDGESALSAGMDLVNNIDDQAELHFVFEDGTHLARLLDGSEKSVAAGMIDLLNGLKRLEVIGDYQRDPPLQITIVMNTAEQAGQLAGLINAGRLMTPGVFDRLEDRLNQPKTASADDLATRSRRTMRDVIALGRTALQNLDLHRDAGTVTISLPDCEGLDRLPQLAGQILGAMIVQPDQWGAAPQPPFRRWEEID